MTTAIVTETARLPLAAFNANVCPKCGSRCGNLINGHCLGCEVQWPEAVETYSCSRCESEFPVLVEQNEERVWLIAEPEGERCPQCGEFGASLQASDPDTFWEAEVRAEEDADDWFSAALTAGERN